MLENKEVALQQYFSFIQNLSGFLTPDMLGLFSCLNEILPSEKPVLEIGVFCGRSLAGLAVAFPKVQAVGVDPFYDDFNLSPAFPEEAGFLTVASNFMSAAERKSQFWKTLNSLNNQYPQIHILERVQLIELTQNDYLKQYSGQQKYQLVHIDGEHTFQAIVDFLDARGEILASNAWIVVDDFLNAGYPDISEAVHTHPGYKKDFWPVFHGFGKGIFVYNPDHQSNLALIKSRLNEIYTNDWHNVLKLYDGSIYVARKSPSPVMQTQNTKNILREIPRYIKKLVTRV